MIFIKWVVSKGIVPLIYIVVLILFTVLNVYGTQQLGVFRLDEFAENGTTYYDINNFNFSVRIVKVNTTNITGLTRRTQNSDSGGPSVVHNKTSKIYPGDVKDFILNDSSGTTRDTLFLIRPTAFYNLSNITYNLTTSNAITNTCSIIKNTSSLIHIACVQTDNYTIHTTSYLAEPDVSQFYMFEEIESNTSNLLVNTGFRTYFDYDVSIASGQESQDEYKAIVNSSQFGPGTEEQITKEGIIVCDGTGQSVIDLQKCDSATNDLFTVKQHLGNGISGTEIFIGASTQFDSNTKIEFYEGFTNPSTDTDGKREVPPEDVNLTSPDLNNKNDIMFVLKIITGNLTQVGSRFKKFFGSAYGNTNLELNAKITESITGRNFQITNLLVRNSSDGSTLTSIGAYNGINITAELTNTGTQNINNINITCIMKHSDGTNIVSNSFLVNITQTEPAKLMQCGGTINANNSIKPGDYTIEWNGTTSTIKESDTNNFIVLSDFVSNSSGISLQSNNFTCNQIINISHNLSNIGNQNFTANITINIFFKNDTFVNNVRNDSILLIKDNNNANTNTTLFCSERPQNLTANITYTLNDENNGVEKYNISIGFSTLGDSLLIFYGYANLSTYLGSNTNILYNYGPSDTGNIFITDADATIDFNSLQAIGIRSNGSLATTDFIDIDTIFGLNLSNYDKTVSSMYSTNGTNPIKTKTFRSRSFSINNVPFANSTGNSSDTAFETGILWDTSDTIINNEFDTTEKEDLIFATKMGKNQTSSLGTVDYMIRIVAFLRELNTTTNQITIYLEPD